MLYEFNGHVTNVSAAYRVFNLMTLLVHSWGTGPPVRILETNFRQTTASLLLRLLVCIRCRANILKSLRLSTDVLSHTLHYNSHRFSRSQLCCRKPVYGLEEKLPFKCFYSVAIKQFLHVLSRID